MSERRRHPRYEAFLSVQIDGADKVGRVGVSHNVSCSGMLLATPSRFEEGQVLELTILGKNGKQKHVRGLICRQSESLGHAFSRKLAITFM